MFSVLPVGYIYGVTNHQQQTRYHLYVDESSQTGRRYMVLGALVLQEPAAAALTQRLESAKQRLGLGREVKWGKVSRSMLAAYQDFTCDVLAALQRDTPSYYSIVVDTSQLDHNFYNGGSSEIGFSKFVYQLVFKCARLLHRPNTVFDCFLDDRTTNQTLTEFRAILNNGMNKNYGVRPFRRVEYRDSKACTLIEAVDVITGAIAYQWNGSHKEDGASPHRIALAELIAERVKLKELCVQTRAGRDAFSIWSFAARPRGAPGRA